MSALGAAALLAIACSRPPDSASEDSEPVDSEAVDSDPGVETDRPGSTDIFVYVTVDTLGATAARQSGWCGRLDGVFGRYGLDGACVDGGIAPGTWTAPSHTRLFFPEYLGEPQSQWDYPECGDEPVFARMAEQLGGSWVFGSDNRTLGRWRTPVCDGEGAYWQGAMQAFDENEGGSELYHRAEEQTADHLAIAAFLEEIAGGRPGVLFFNVFEAGGHSPPRCAADPFTPACEALWQVLVDNGHDPDADRTETWLGYAGSDLNEIIEHRSPERVDEIRPIWWASILEQIESFHEPKLEARLVLLLDGLEAQGRLGDLVLVLAADHGENPAVVIAPGEISMLHASLPTEWTVNVPAFVVPAEVATSWQARGFIGDETAFWSTANFAWAMLDEAGGTVPDVWAPMEPVGTATSWICSSSADPGMTSGLLHIDGDVAVRCRNADCTGLRWRIPTSYDDASEPLAEVPEALLPWAAAFDARCH